MKSGQSFFMPVRIVTGIGCADQVAEEIKQLAAQRVFLITDKGVREAGLTQGIEDILQGCGVEYQVYEDVPPEPAVRHADGCGQAAKDFQPDLILGVGGGSVLDIAKAAAILVTNPGSIKDYFGTGLVKNPGVPTVLMPTTSGTGSEVTPNAIFLDEEIMVKVGVVTPYNYARAAIVDAALTLSAPAKLTAATG
ncbi:MAG: iron-containing alcohol dehydrogenase, partial [Limnochordia bacterium]